jgi:mannose-6-phosphate isomerase
LKIPPFLLEPVLKPKPWGGRSLEQLFNRQLPEGEKIGESWELCARPNDSNIILSGPLSGRTLLDALNEYPKALLGEGICAIYGGNLPILAKFIDASDRLSIQVHPDDCMAKALGETDSGKEEAWYVVSARPGASLVIGTTLEMAFDELLEFCGQGRHNDCLNFVQVEAGDVIAVPPGTLHAIGKGIVLFEVSQNSDITYRFDDWDRNIPGRELHRDKVREVLVCKPPVMPKSRQSQTAPLTVLHKAQHFHLLEAYPAGNSVLLEGGVFASITTIEGSLEVEGEGESIKLAAGRTAFAPASISGVRVSGHGRVVIACPV